MRPMLVALLLAAFPVDVRQPIDTWLVFVDDLHVPFMETGQLRAMVRAFAADVLYDGAFCALYTSGPSGVAIDLTSDHSPLVAATKKLAGNGLRADDIALINSQQRMPNEVTSRRDLAVTMLAARLEDVTFRHGPPGSLLIFSSGYFDDSEYRAQLHEHLRGVLRPDTNVFVIDPRQPDGTITERLAAGRVTVTP